MECGWLTLDQLLREARCECVRQELLQPLWARYAGPAAARRRKLGRVQLSKLPCELTDAFRTDFQYLRRRMGKPGIEDVELTMRSDVEAYHGRLGQAREFSRSPQGRPGWFIRPADREGRKRSLSSCPGSFRRSNS